jgi:uncharacterized protein YciW
MALSPAEKQRHYRERLKAKAAADPRTLEAALLVEAERGKLSDQKRIALADRLTEMAKQHLWRAHELSQIAYRLRVGEEHPRREDKQ